MVDGERVLRHNRAMNDDQDIFQALHKVYSLDVDQLLERTPNVGSRRTLQRRLAALVKAGHIQTMGKARATRYLLGDNAKLRASPTTEPIRYVDRYDNILREGDEPTLPAAPAYSEVADDVRLMVRRPIFERPECSYRREFLDAYEPNVTFYLPEATRERLKVLGDCHRGYDDHPPGTWERQILDRVLIDLSFYSSRLEGNTYSFLETERLLAMGQGDDLKRAKDAIMILNHKTVIEMMVMNHSQCGFNRYTFQGMHGALTAELLKDEDAGALRTRPVGITGSRFHPTNNPALIEECFDLVLAKADAIRDPLECSLFLLVHLPYLQPFIDGNKRTSRLAANLPLLKHQMAPISFIGVPVRDYTDAILSVYELNRVEPMSELFAWAYQVSAANYGVLRQDEAMVDPRVLHYRSAFMELAREVVVQRLDKRRAAEHIGRWASEHVRATDRDWFIEKVEKRLLGMNTVTAWRYRLLPSDFEEWRNVWK
jgi:fido (protein-threonine AMPylation protein)